MPRWLDKIIKLHVSSNDKEKEVDQDVHDSGQHKPSESINSQEVDAEFTPEVFGLFNLGEEKSPEEYNVDIVAVHGLGGHWKKTWTAENGKMWLRDFLPNQLPTARIMSYGYNSKTAFSKSVTDIEDESTLLLNYLAGERRLEVEKSRPILFISHSLGGIIVKKVSAVSRLSQLIKFTSLKYKGNDSRSRPFKHIWAAA